MKKILIICAGRTAYNITRVLKETINDFLICGYYDFMNNNPYNFKMVKYTHLLKFDGQFLIASNMKNTVNSVETELINLGIDKSKILKIDELNLNIKLDLKALSFLKKNIQLNAELFEKIVRAKFNNDFDTVADMNLFLKCEEEYKEFSMIKNGDVIIDCGTFDGSTAFDMLKEANWNNENTKVYSFDASLKFLKEQHKHEKISFIEKALFYQTCKVNFHEYPGIEAPGSFTTELNHNKSSSKNIVQATSIDDFCRKNKISRVNYIKMDVEGSEPEVLKGALKTIDKYKPRMAVSIYHKLEHHWELPMYVLEKFPFYKMAFSHYSNYFDGSIMYFSPEDFKIASN